MDDTQCDLHPRDTRSIRRCAGKLPLYQAVRMSISLKYRVESLYTPWFQSNGQTADASCCPSFWLSFRSYLLLNGSSTCVFMLYFRHCALIVFFFVVLVVVVLSFLSVFLFSYLLFLLLLFFLVSKIAACGLPPMHLLLFQSLSVVVLVLFVVLFLLLVFSFQCDFVESFDELLLCYEATQRLISSPLTSSFSYIVLRYLQLPSYVI